MILINGVPIEKSGLIRDEAYTEADKLYDELIEQENNIIKQTGEKDVKSI